MAGGWLSNTYGDNGWDGVSLGQAKNRTDPALKAIRACSVGLYTVGDLKLSLIHLILVQQLPFSLQRSKKAGEE